MTVEFESIYLCNRHLITRTLASLISRTEFSLWLDYGEETQVHETLFRSLWKKFRHFYEKCNFYIRLSQRLFENPGRRYVFALKIPCVGVMIPDYIEIFEELIRTSELTRQNFSIVSTTE